MSVPLSEERVCWKCGCLVIVVENFDDGALCAKCRDALNPPEPGRLSDAQVERARKVWDGFEERDRQIVSEGIAALRFTTLCLALLAIAVLFVFWVFFGRRG